MLEREVGWFKKPNSMPNPRQPGFTRVYSMLGGITAWIKAGYPIYTTYHYVTVNVLEEEIFLQIDPLLFVWHLVGQFAEYRLQRNLYYVLYGQCLIVGASSL